jgi:hypothetical protein
MKTALWTVLAFACGIMTVACFTGLVDGIARISIFDGLIAGALMLAFGVATRGAWRKARGARHLETARLPDRDDRPWRR